MTSLFLISFLTALLLSFILTRVVRDVAVARGWVVAPASERHIHARPIPRLGGVAIFLSTVIVGGLLGRFAGFFRFVRGLHPKFFFAFLVWGTLIFFLGFSDVFSPAKLYVKFFVQGLAAVILFGMGLEVQPLPLLFGSLDLGWLVSL